MPTVSIWPYWVDQGTQGVINIQNCQTLATTAVTNDPWHGWVQIVPQPTVTTGAINVWVNWQTATTLNIGLPPTTEVTKRQTLINRNRTHARQLRRKIAARRAEALLLAHLSERQRQEWTSERAFTVHTAGGKRAYKIAYGLAGNVRLIEAEELLVGKHGYPLRVGARFCMHVYHPDGQVPNEDNVLAQKLLIEANEPEFLRLANVS